MTATRGSTIRIALRALATVLALVVVGPAAAQTEVQTEAQTKARRSGFAFMGPSTQAMQRDDAQNPAMLWVGEGAELWTRKAGRADRACADCHGDAKTSMRGVAARYPAYDTMLGRAVTLGERIGLCRTRHQQADAFAPESDPRLALEAYVALQSRGQPIAPPDDPRLAAPRERGRSLWQTRIGQLDLACAQCHDAHAGGRLGGSTIPEGHPTAYPIYRLEWQGLGSLERRLRGCMTGVRAEPAAWGSADLVDLQVWLAWRARGMVVESPGVRP